MKNDRLVAAALAGGSVLAATWAGSRFSPRTARTGLWYASLRKPRYTPPGPAIGAVWSVLDVLLGYAGYRLIAERHRPGAVEAIAAWLTTVSGLAGFQAAFFGAKSPAAGTATSAAMCAAATTTAGLASRIDPSASAAMAPLALWTGFATFLSEEIWRRNRA